MSETKRRDKQAPPRYEEARAPRQTRVTLAKDVSSKYRKFIPKAGGRPFEGGDGSAPPRRRPTGASPRPSRPPRAPRAFGDRAPRPFGDRPPRTFGDRPPRAAFDQTAVKAIVNRGLPEAVKQVTEARDVIAAAAEVLLELAEQLNAAHDKLKNKLAQNDEMGLWPDLEKAENAVTRIFENMSFQDLAGQRLMKVDDFFKALDEALKKAPEKKFSEGQDRPRGPRRDFGERKPFGRRDDGEKRPRREGGERKSFGPRKERPEKTGKSQFSSSRADKAAKSQLKGPQAEGGGMGQNDIDALLANL